MAHFLQTFAQHYHLSGSQYTQLRLVCSITLGPLLAVLYLVFFTKREPIGQGVKRVKQRVQALPHRLAARQPIQPVGS